MGLHNQLLPDTFPLASGMNRNSTNSSPDERRRQRVTTMRRQ